MVSAAVVGVSLTVVTVSAGASVVVSVVVVTVSPVGTEVSATGSVVVASVVDVSTGSVGADVSVIVTESVVVDVEVGLPSSGRTVVGSTVVVAVYITVDGGVDEIIEEKVVSVVLTVVVLDAVLNGFVLSVDSTQAPGVVVGTPFAMPKQYGCFVIESKNVTPDGAVDEPTVTLAAVRLSMKLRAA